MRNGFSEEQLKGVNFDAIWSAVSQGSKKEPMPESQVDGTKTLHASTQELLAMETSSALFQGIHTNGHPREEFIPASAKVDAHQDSQHPVATAAPPVQVPDDGVMSIAIIGMSCSFPGGANDIGKLWDLVSEGRAAWSKVPESRFNVDAFYHPDSNRSDCVSFRTRFGMIR